MQILEHCIIMCLPALSSPLLSCPVIVLVQCVYSNSLCCAVLCCAVLLCCAAVLCCAALLCCAVLCCAVLRDSNFLIFPYTGFYWSVDPVTKPRPKGSVRHVLLWSCDESIYSKPAICTSSYTWDSYEDRLGILIIFSRPRWTNEWMNEHNVSSCQAFDIFSEKTNAQINFEKSKKMKSLQQQHKQHY